MWRLVGGMAIALLPASGAVAQSLHCSDNPAFCMPGGGSPQTDCAFEWLLPGLSSKVSKGLPSGGVVCYEGDPACDADPDLDNASCSVPIALCINNLDARLGSCSATNVATFSMLLPSATHKRDFADVDNLTTLETVANQDLGLNVLRRNVLFLPGATNATVDACSAPALLEVPLHEHSSGPPKRNRKTFRVAVTDSTGRRDVDKIQIECRPSTCGNGTRESYEECDDGNRDNGDGCNQGCHIERPSPTPTPTRTGTPAPPTVTATRTITPTPSTTPTITPIPSDTASRTPTQTRTRTVTFTRTPSVTITPTLTAVPPPPTDTPPPSLTPTITATPVIALAITAYRPQSEYYGNPFDQLAVPASENLSPGVGMRVNGDDDNDNGIADSSDTSVTNENDLVEITLQANPSTPPAGVEYVLSRGNAEIAVWTDSIKAQLALLDVNDEIVLHFSGATRNIWVERRAAGQTMLTLSARPIGGGPALASAQVQLFTFTGEVIALGGEDQTPTDPPASGDGTFVIAKQLYTMGYDVHMYDEDNVGGDGAGAVYDEVVSAIRTRGVTNLAIYGHSHGGGSTHDLASLLADNHASIGSFSIAYTAYMDGIKNSSDINILSETRLPPGTAYHVNYYQRNEIYLRGDSVSGSAIDVNVNSTPWGADLQHGGVDDAPEVRDSILSTLVAHIAP